MLRGSLFSFQQLIFRAAAGNDTASIAARHAAEITGFS